MVYVRRAKLVMVLDVVPHVFGTQHERIVELTIWLAVDH